MKTKLYTTLIIHSALLAIVACGISSCASFEHPLARHDMDGDRVISDPEYRQNRMQYSLGSIQRHDEISRARHVTDHMANVGDFISEARDATYLIRNFTP